MNTEIIKAFYTSLSNGDVDGMARCYHEKIQFHDPVFGSLYGDEVADMWRMIVSRNKNINIAFGNIKANDKTGSADWQAAYVFSRTARKVLNKISASFEFEDGKIIKHTDNFDLWKWSRQALGLTGFLFGWTSSFQHKLQKQSRELLEGFRNGPLLKSS
jgi:ketosteroid isomerase-like protein